VLEGIARALQLDLAADDDLRISAWAATLLAPLGNYPGNLLEKIDVFLE
jgi:hypothetical protein